MFSHFLFITSGDSSQKKLNKDLLLFNLSICLAHNTWHATSFFIFGKNAFNFSNVRHDVKKYWLF